MVVAATTPVPASLSAPSSPGAAFGARACVHGDGEARGDDNPSPSVGSGVCYLLKPGAHRVISAVSAKGEGVHRGFNPGFGQRF